MSKVPMRDGYGKALLELCEKNPKVMVLDADVAKSTRTVWIRDQYPEKFLDMGISEQDMVGTAAGLALSGMVPFTSTYCVFLAGRAWDQIRTTVCYNRLNVKLGGAHAGISVGPDGATHQSLEDIALMRALPDMVVLNPCDFNQTKNATIAAAKYEGPVYLRFGRPSVPNFTPENEEFVIGKAQVMNEGKDVTIVACGHLVWEALQAAELLEAEGICAEVINMATIKPLDEETLLVSASKTKAVVVAEEHNMAGGLGEAVAGVFARTLPTPVEFINGADRFGQTGTPSALMAAYGLDAQHIAEAAKKAISRK